MSSFSPIWLKKMSPELKAKLKAEIANADKPKKVRPPKTNTYQLKDASHFAAWCNQFPGPAKLFGYVIRRWGASSATTRDSKGFWAAYTHEEWCKFAKVAAVSTLKHQLNRLEEAGLIEREQHRYNGTAVKSFIRPTALALTISRAKEASWEHLGQPKDVSFKDKSAIAAMEGVYRDAYLAHTGHPLSVVSKADRAALRSILKELPDNAVKIVDTAVRSWPSFALAALLAKGLYKTPQKPSLIFIRTHLQAAVEFLVAQTAEAEQAEKIKELKAAQLSKLSVVALCQQPAVVQPGEPKATLADLLDDDE
ncbi:hypothetical protein HFO74_27160 [Rhizobium laguerreae]|uniref:Helix-turn-helix domain-containing protein n=1 Tax=Rhizobium laguerreae TaxID=1076926 RepID=A0AB35FL77_9HYPH|nr:hypothetical protein [Rhizobium laguerreae]MBY3067057.1 hypothetical protein [Rhizobium laguerreae]MBY3080056.1 hypothetical protein [Rhizobium laguerreae]